MMATAMRSAAVLACGLMVQAAGAHAQDMRFMSIGTGGIGGTYYPIGGLIAQAVSSPPGSRPCDRGGSCGVPGLVASAQSSGGSVDNARAVAAGTLDSAFVQSDVASWAYVGSGIFEGEPPRDNLRAIASLYAESMHLVARRDAEIAGVADLRGRRVSLDEPGSGTLADARLILDAFAIGDDDIEPVYIKSTPAIARMIAGELDAFFLLAGYPAVSVTELVEAAEIDLVPIEGPEVEALIAREPFLSADIIPAEAYPGLPATPTVAVNALWVVAEGMHEDFVHALTAALWNEATRRLLDAGHAKAKAITLETALDGIGIPLHPGAQRFYREQGLL